MRSQPVKAVWVEILPYPAKYQYCYRYSLRRLCGLNLGGDPLKARILSSGQSLCGLPAPNPHKKLKGLPQDHFRLRGALLSSKHPNTHSNHPSTPHLILPFLFPHLRYGEPDHRKPPTAAIQIQTGVLPIRENQPGIGIGQTDVLVDRFVCFF